MATMLAASAAKLSRRRTGALIVIERDTALGDMAETGVTVDGRLSSELLASLFAPGYPLHDGAVIVSGEVVVAAGVMLPLAERDGSMEQYGTRHRAALGVTEQTDALAIVVSEESGAISLTQGGRIMRDLDEEELRQRLYGLLSPADVTSRARRYSLRSDDEQDSDDDPELGDDDPELGDDDAGQGDASDAPAMPAVTPEPQPRPGREGVYK
jgi:diadenylate cyclase